MKKILYLFIFVFLVLNLGFSQGQSDKPTVLKPTYFDISPPLRDMVQQPSTQVDMTWKDGIVKNKLNTFSNYDEADEPDFIDPVRQDFFGQVQTDTTILNYEGVGMAGYLPPDTDGDVGPNHYMQVVNCRFAIWDKAGNKIYGPVNTSTVWQGMPHNNNDGDAIILYDENADRWLISQFALPTYPYGPFYENVAISQTPDPTGSWYRYQYTFTDMPDYPKLSVWGDGYYMTIRRFASGTGNWLGPSAIALHREKMLAGDATTEMVMFNLPSSSEGPLAADCDSEFPPDTTPCPVCYLISGTNASIKINNFHVDWTNTANSSFTLANTVPISEFSTFGNGLHIDQKGTTRKLDAFSRKGIMHRMPFRKFSDHWTMLLNTTVKLTGPVAGIRWMEVRNTGSGWTLFQEGTYSPDNNHRWMGSIAIDTIGNIALGYSIASTTMYPSIRYTGRLNGDPLGEMTIGEKGIWNGTGSQSDPSGRWGDYSAMVADPVDIGTFWYTQEYIIGGSWRTRIASFSWGDILAVDATATPDVICSPGEMVQLNVTAGGGSGVYTYSWTSDPPGFNSDLQNPVVYPTGTTDYIATVSDGTQTKSDTVTVTLQPLPTVFAGSDTAYCWWVPFFFVTGTASNYSSVSWTTQGDGHFNYQNQLTNVYYPGDMDRQSGGVTLTLSAFYLEPCDSDSASDDIFVDLVCTGTEQPDYQKFSVSIQPNPSNGVLIISLTGVNDQHVNLSVLDLRGRMVYHEDFRSPSVAMDRKIDLSSLSKGTYLFKVETGKDQKIEKIVIQ